MENNSKRAPKISTDKGTDVNGENPDAVNGVIVIDDDVEEQQRVEEQEDEHEEEEGEEESQPQQPSSTRTPFTDLSQVDADWALARTLQEQERAYMMLRMNTEGSDYGSWEAGSYEHDEDDDFNDPNDETDEDAEAEEAYDATDIDDEEDAFDVHAHAEAEDDDNPAIEYDPDIFSSDEAYARALQDAEEREMAARMLALAGINEVLTPEEVLEMEEEEHPTDLQDRWEEVDPDELSYEELLALGEMVGFESRGLSTDTIASLPSVQYKSGGSQHGSSDSCVICRLDYEEEETLTVLSCKHSYHSECINNWLQINKVCPVCSAEVVTAGNS